MRSGMSLIGWVSVCKVLLVFKRLGDCEELGERLGEKLGESVRGLVSLREVGQVSRMGHN